MPEGHAGTDGESDEVGGNEGCGVEYGRRHDARQSPDHPWAPDVAESSDTRVAAEVRDEV